MTSAIVPGAEQFQIEADFALKKRIVQKLELAIQSGQLRLDERQQLGAATSTLDLDRITLYLFEEHSSEPPNYKMRKTRIEHEAQLLRASNFESSLMPLSYALGSFIAMLRSRPRMLEEARRDASLFYHIRADLNDNPHVDRGGQVKRDLEEILETLGLKSEMPTRIKKAEDDKSLVAAVQAFFTTIPGILTGAAAVITAVTGLYLATKGGDNKPAPSADNVTFLVVEGVELFPQRPDSYVQLIAEVNGIEFRFPSLEGVEWAEVGIGMSTQQFRVPRSENGYQVRIRGKLRSNNVEKELVSQETKFITAPPSQYDYRLYERAGISRSARVEAVVRFSLRSGS